MTVKEIKESNTENLILTLCRLYNRETKKARISEQRIIKELAKRNIVNEDVMNDLFDSTII